MKKILVSALAVSFALTINAQKISGEKQPDFKHHPGMMKYRNGMMLKELDLTDGQKQQFKIENESFRKQMEDLKKNDNITVKEWKSRMQHLRDDHKTKMQGLLTQDQKAKLEKLKAEKKAKHEEMAKKRADKMKTSLGLSNEQSMKLDISGEETKSRINAIMENKSLSAEQKKEQFKELRKQQKERMKSILTEEQLKQLKERKPGK